MYVDSPRDEIEQAQKIVVDAVTTNEYLRELEAAEGRKFPMGYEIERVWESQE